MDWSGVIAFAFLGSIFMFSRFSKYSRRLSNTWGMEPEEMERLECKAKIALQASGMLLAATVICIVLALVLPRGGQ